MQRCSSTLQHDGVCSDAGLSMVVTALSMGITAILVALLLTTMLKSSGNSNTSINNTPGVSGATAIQAQQTLSTALTTVDAAATSGGYGSLNATALSASNPSIAFVSGPSSNADTVSVAIIGGSGDTAEFVGNGGGGGSVTLADRSTNGTCWLVWKSSAAATWYGAQTDLSSCTAPALASAPSPGPVTSTSIGWQQGSFPPAP